MDINHLNKPIPCSYTTFDSIAKQYRGYSPKNRIKFGTRVKGFGSRPRFDPDENSKWKKKVEMWNRNRTENFIDPSKDATPGPQAYSMIAHWKRKKGSDKDLKRGSNMLAALSTGPKISIYYK